VPPASIVEDEEPDCWVFFDESGQEYCGEEEPRQWRGTPKMLAKKILTAIYYNGKLPKELPWLAAIDEPEHVELGYYATEREAALAYDRAMILLYGNDAETDFAPEESEHGVFSDEVMRQLDALKGGRGRLH
jgi:hypothetical protein